MTHKFFEVRRNSYSIVTIVGEVMCHFSQREIIGLDQSVPGSQKIKAIHHRGTENTEKSFVLLTALQA